MRYEYNCPKCGHEQEEELSSKFEGEINCSQCSRISRRIISGGSGIIFKGTGFHSTDYKNK
jgi:putative FmdB family regulatory protein